VQVAEIVVGLGDEHAHDQECEHERAADEAEHVMPPLRGVRMNPRAGGEDPAAGPGAAMG
jgi:hypothetical protein